MLESVPLVWGGAVTFVSVLFAAYLKWFRFYTSVYVPRKLDLYDRLSASAPEQSEVKEVLSIAAEEEIFRIVFSQGGTPEYRRSLIGLYQSDKFSLRELQLSKSCLDVDKTIQAIDGNPRPIVGSFGLPEQASLWLLSITLVLSFLFFGGLFLSLVKLSSSQGLIAAFIAFILFILTIFMLGSELVRLVISLKVCRRLQELNSDGCIAEERENSA